MGLVLGSLREHSPLKSSTIHFDLCSDPSFACSRTCWAGGLTSKAERKLQLINTNKLDKRKQGIRFSVLLQSFFFFICKNDNLELHLECYLLKTGM